MAPLTWLQLVLGHLCFSTHPPPGSLALSGQPAAMASEGSVPRGRRWSLKALEVQPRNSDNHPSCHILLCNESPMARGRGDGPHLWEEGTSPRAEGPGYRDAGNLWPYFAVTEYASLGFCQVLTLQGLGSGELVLKSLDTEPKITR